MTQRHPMSAVTANLEASIWCESNGGTLGCMLGATGSSLRVMVVHVHQVLCCGPRWVRVQSGWGWGCRWVAVVTFERVAWRALLCSASFPGVNKCIVVAPSVRSACYKALQAREQACSSVKGLLHGAHNNNSCSCCPCTHLSCSRHQPHHDLACYVH